MAFLWIVTLLGAIVGGLVFVGTLMGARSAPQEAAGFAMAMACVVIPYVFTRACEGLNTGLWQRKLIDAIEDVGRKMQASAATSSGPRAPNVAALPLSTSSAAPSKFRTTQQSLDELRAAGATVKDHNGGWEITLPSGQKNYAYNDNDLNKCADRYGASAPVGGSALDRVAASGWTAGPLKE